MISSDVIGVLSGDQEVDDQNLVEDEGSGCQENLRGVFEKG